MAARPHRLSLGLVERWPLEVGLVPRRCTILTRRSQNTCNARAEMSQSVLDRTGFRDTNIAEQTRRSAACAVGMGGCAQGREVRRYYRGAGDTVQSASSRGSSSPGVARTATAQARLLSALVRRSRQACGRTAPSSSAMCSSADVCDQFCRDTNFDHVLNG